MAQSHILFLACTRPALIAGIPIEAALACGTFVAETFLISGMFTQSLWRIGWLFGSSAGSYVACRLLAKRDHNIFRILWIWMQTKGRTSRNAAYWGGSSA